MDPCCCKQPTDTTLPNLLAHTAYTTLANSTTMCSGSQQHYSAPPEPHAVYCVPPSSYPACSWAECHRSRLKATCDRSRHPFALLGECATKTHDRKSKPCYPCVYTCATKSTVHSQPSWTRTDARYQKNTTAAMHMQRPLPETARRCQPAKNSHAIQLLPHNAHHVQKQPPMVPLRGQFNAHAALN